MSIDVIAPIACCAPLAAPSLSDDEAEATAAVFRALGDPARVRIVNLLATSDEPVCICNLVEPLGLSQPTVSHHMKKLVDAGLVGREQRGKWAFFDLKADARETLAGCRRHRPPPLMPALGDVRALVAEAIGTFALVFAGCGAIMVDDRTRTSSGTSAWR